MTSGEHAHDADVVVIGSGFGGSVAALRFAELGERVVVLERGDRVQRKTFEVDLDALWAPRRHRFGMNDIHARGDNIVPWLGAAVGGGSHVYAGTMKRAETFEGFPEPLRADDMGRWYDLAEDVMEPAEFPDWPPYDGVRATQLLFRVGDRLQEKHPELVEDHGPIHLAISFAPEDATAGAEFENKHGATQRYFDPREQSLLGGDIGAKNTLDRNYLFLAEKRGTEIRPLCEAEQVEPLADGGYRVTYRRYVKEAGWLRRLVRGYAPALAKPRDVSESVTARRVVVAAGSIGSTELLLRCRDVHGTLPDIGAALGTRYTTNGDYVSLMLPFRGLFVSWFGVVAVVAGLVLASWWVAGAGALAYFVGLWISRRPFDPDIGTTNSDYVRFRGEDGSSQGAYIESGRYPTPVRFGLAVILSALGLWRPKRYAPIVRLTRWLRRLVPPFAAIARSWPIPLLKMGRDQATGTFRLDPDGRAVIDYDLEKNRRFYAYLDRLARMVAKEARAWWAPNLLFRVTKKLEIPHNQGGVPMGDSPDDGVVDHAGRAFAYDDLLVLDGSILPVSPGPNPALTILAVAERAMDVVGVQVANGEPVRATHE